MDVKSILGVTAFLLMIAAIVGLVANFILNWTRREDLEDTNSPWISTNTTGNATENSTCQNLDHQWANDKIINLSYGKG